MIRKMVVVTLLVGACGKTTKATHDEPANTAEAHDGLEKAKSDLKKAQADRLALADQKAQAMKDAQSAEHALGCDKNASCCEQLANSHDRKERIAATDVLSLYTRPRGHLPQSVSDHELALGSAILHLGDDVRAERPASEVLADCTAVRTHFAAMTDNASWADEEKALDADVQRWQAAVADWQKLSASR